MWFLGFLGFGLGNELVMNILSSILWVIFVVIKILNVYRKVYNNDYDFKILNVIVLSDFVIELVF